MATCHPDRKAYGRGLCSACYQREWRQRNPEASKASGRRYAERHPERVAAAHAKRKEERAATHDARMTANAERARHRTAERLGDRFWSKVDRSGDCWTWTASRTRHGYGRIGLGHDRVETAHRVSWMLANGPIPEGVFVCHRCDNPPCVRPDHLFLGTALDNIRDMIAKGRGRGQYEPGNYPARWRKASVA